jgi:heterodisulfide reductase subunit A-like polyferredoxin
MWKKSFRTVFSVLALSKVANARHYPLPTVETDVVILGGGASGTYAAVRLREDYGKKVLLVEMEAVLVHLPISIASGQNS